MTVIDASEQPNGQSGVMPPCSKWARLTTNARCIMRAPCFIGVVKHTVKIAMPLTDDRGKF